MSDADRWEPCPRCGQSLQRARRWPEGRVCHYCATAALQRTGSCASCDHQGVLPGLDATGSPTCQTCSQIPSNIHCRRCGTESPLGRSSTCWRCLLTRRIEALLAGPDGAFSPALQPLADALLGAPNANSTHTWLSSPVVADMLNRLASGEINLDHAAFDELPDSRVVEHLRGLLVGAGCLPSRDPHLARYERWLAAKLETVDSADHRAIVDRFARWHLLRQLRDRATDGPISDGAFLNAKQTTTVSLSFLTWLAERDTTIEDLTQHDLDSWFASGPSTRKHAIRFLYWARDQHMIGTVEIPVPRTANAAVVGQRQRFEHLHRVLTDETIDLAPRVASVLVLLFGLSFDQIVRITVDDIVRHDDGVNISLGRETIPLPQPVTELFDAFLDDPRYRRNTAGNHLSRWLFPGTRPGRPIHLDTVRALLETAQVPHRAARAGTWLELVRDAPPAVLAEALGVSPSTAMRYAKRAGAHYAAYPSAAQR